MIPSRLAAALGVAILLVLTSSSLASAHLPTPGTRLFEADNKLLKWQYYETGYPSWFASGVETALNVDHQDPTVNNSKTPVFQKPADGTGSGTIRFWSGAAAPSACGGALVWLGCAWGGGTTSWVIAVHNFDAAPYSQGGRDWKWYDTTNSCNTATKTCFDLRRTVSHETLHIQNGSAHSTEACTDTAFNSGQASYPNGCWNNHRYRRCDEASGQINYGVRDLYGDYADCFDNIANHGSDGLKTDLTTAAAAYAVCSGQQVTVYGRLQTHPYLSYGLTGGLPLAGRTVTIDRNGVPSYASDIADASSVNNWSAAFSLTTPNTVTHNYVAHFDSAPGDGLDPPSIRAFSITWVKPADC